ncbi:ornithine carbamoyltransferase [Platysternon megacephalum]|uniref:Ornithine carbamoyltransferase n=1 Tax=Platysternon megacephalum TaxID=55544 RepID=A0A4D9DDF3_9SAUR|nr:ornithine carbamoyltransferase [Platysternon megacephalum]
MDCVMCGLANGVEPDAVYFADDDIVAVTPLRKMSRVHYVLLPREHIDDLPTLLRDHPKLAAKIMQRAAEIATERKIDATGYRLVWNFGPDTKQRIPHPHLHLLGGQRMTDTLA